jgi:Bcr/CflA subfamily drug resistance transporter
MAWLVFLNCLIVSVSIFCRDMTIPSLPAIASSLHTSEGLAQTSLTICLAGVGLSQLFYGPLSDAYGRKKILLTGFTICLMGNIASGVAASDSIFLISRFLAGIGAGAGTVIARAMARDMFQKSQLTKVLSYLSMSTTVSPAIAPLLGGYLQSYLGWRYVFLLLSIITLFSIITIFLFITETNNNEPIVNGINWKKTLDNYFNLIIDPWFLGYSLISALSFTTGIIYYIVSPFIFQREVGISPDQNGWIYILVAISYFLGSFITSKVTEIIADEKIILIGIHCCAISAVCMVILGISYHNLLSIIIPISFSIIGCGIITPVANKQGLNPYPDMAGTASALLSATRMLCAFIISLFISKMNINSFFIWV